MVRKKDNPANNPDQRSLFDADGNIRKEFYEKLEDYVNQNKSSVLKVSAYEKLLNEIEENHKSVSDKYEIDKKSSDTQIGESNIIYKKIKDLITADELDSYEEIIYSMKIKSYIEDIVEKKVNDELDRRLGKECYKSKAESLFSGSGKTISVKALQDYMDKYYTNDTEENGKRSVFDGGEATVKALQEYLIRNNISKPDFLIEDQLGNKHSFEVKMNQFTKNPNKYDYSKVLKMFAESLEKSLNTPSLMTVSKCKVKSKVKEVLEEQGQTVSYLVRMTGISRSTMNSIMTNSNEISLKNAYKISIVLEKPIEELFPFVVDRDEVTSVIDTDNED